MSTPSDGARAIVYGHIGDVGEARARRELCSPGAGDFLTGVAQACLPRVRGLRAGAAGDRALVTVLLHYALSAAAVPSHRKVSVRGTEVDIVVPDARTLAASPRRALVICLPEDATPGGLERAAAAAGRAQPVAANVAVALCASAAGSRVEAYSVEDGTLGGILGRARDFLGSTGGGRLGILGSPAGAEQGADVHRGPQG
ncbi:MAG: hypothetical protein OXU86_05610 [Thaumarchaeota archaeon]|nr:hypothetical protein [Nitrososphaerota archaeon]MDD9826228.1 hypothetical protein [Nitrososphaerota archaeon]RNJ71286.1 MAG: hypothetical protein EB832_06490 [Thaumarchaeota archaeon S14]RNJ73420.1 MAG: hypothetical protein EB833_02865 [Thaumarchaeota archaeon S13]